MLADAGLTEQDVARRIVEWTAVLGERSDDGAGAGETNPATEVGDGQS